jgi:hypothetical protein
LARRANSKEFKPVRDGFESVFFGDAFFDFAGKALIQLHDVSATSANEMMVMASPRSADQLETSCAVAEVKPLNHLQFFQQMHCSVNSCQIAISLRHGA